MTLLDKITDSDGNTIREFTPKIRNTIEMPEAYWDAIHAGMRQVIENKSYFSDLAVNVAGKDRYSGTAQDKAKPCELCVLCAL